jgi:hypothetical protein
MFHLQRNRVPECHGAKSDGLNEDAAREARQGFQFSRNLLFFSFFIEKKFLLFIKLHGVGDVEQSLDYFILDPLL